MTLMERLHRNRIMNSTSVNGIPERLPNVSQSELVIRMDSTVESDAQTKHNADQFVDIAPTSCNGSERSDVSVKAEPSAARITEIDISWPALALGVLRWSDYMLIVVGGGMALNMLQELVTSAFNAQWVQVMMYGAVAGFLAFGSYTGWRHTGVIDHRVWRSYLYLFLLLGALSVFGALLTAITILSQGKFLENLLSWLVEWTYLYIAGVSILGLVCVILLRRTRIAPTRIRLDELLAQLAKHRGMSALSLTKIPRNSLKHGLAYCIVGAIVLLGTTFWSLPEESKQLEHTLRIINQLNLFGFFCLLRARRHFQVSADSLLAVDKRQPILFLRSFSDDPKENYNNAQKALLDFSLETRLANHFHYFGPFIAIGSPTDSDSSRRWTRWFRTRGKEALPLPGAARVLLSDDQWQRRVQDWIKSSGTIIMYSGATEWVNWELRKVVESGRTDSLILMFPEIKTWRPSRRKRDIATRVACLRAVFKDSPWDEELMEFTDFSHLRAMLFRADGSMMMIRSRSRSRDSYHLAALIAHHQLLNPLPIQQDAVATADTPRTSWAKGLALGLACLALVVAGYLFLSNSDSRLTFKQGVLYYREPVTQVDAEKIGEYLVQQQFFSDQKAVTVLLSQEHERYRVGFVVDQRFTDDVLTLIQFGVMGSDISREGLEGRPVEVMFYDTHSEPIRIVPASWKLNFGKGELYYTEPITVDQARGVIEELSEFFGDDTAVSVHLGRDQGTYQLRFVIEPSVIDDPEVFSDFSRLSRIIARRALGAQLVVMHLCDSGLHTLKRDRIEAVP